VNLIGEHTDYNDGLVMPVAIEFATYVEVTDRQDRRLAVYSENYSDAPAFDLDDPDPKHAAIGAITCAAWRWRWNAPGGAWRGRICGFAAMWPWERG
jgi:galactokinase